MQEGRRHLRILRADRPPPGGLLRPRWRGRYWHVSASRYDRDAFLADKDQIYAEAVVRDPLENLWLDTAALQAAHDAIVTTVMLTISSLATARGAQSKRQ